MSFDFSGIGDLVDDISGTVQDVSDTASDVSGNVATIKDNLGLNTPTNSPTVAIPSNVGAAPSDIKPQQPLGFNLTAWITANKNLLIGLGVVGLGAAALWVFSRRRKKA